MGVKQHKVEVSELMIGMYVSGLDRPWSQTPFPLQGFYIRDQQDIIDLRHYCRFVYVDVAKAGGDVAANLKTLTQSKNKIVNTRTSANNTVIGKIAPLKIRKDIYPVTSRISSEIGKAKVFQDQIFNALGSVTEALDQGADRLPIDETKKAASNLVDSVIRSPDAFTWLAKIREKDEYTYTHAIRCAVLALLFGRHIGLPKSELNSLALGVLLKDIGKNNLPQHILQNTERNRQDQLAYEQFVSYGVDILRNTPDVQPRVTSLVKTHCERINGSGFPAHLRGDKIPLLGKIAGIVTFYDETTNPRNRTKPFSPSKAVAKLYELRNVQFQDELVVEFIRAIGLYPTGTIVELNTGEIAVVVEQHFERRLKPLVMVVMDGLGQLLPSPVLLDLAEVASKNQKLIDQGVVKKVTRIEIVSDLEPEQFPNIHVGHILGKYLKYSPKRGPIGWLKKAFR